MNTESQVKEPVYMQWGDLKFGISKNDMSNTFSAFVDIPKKDILENINSPFEIIDTRSDQTFNMEKAGLNCYYTCQNYMDPNGIRIESFDVGQWNNFISTLKSNLTVLSDACRFNLTASFEETVFVVRIVIKDEPTRKLYLEKENHRYITEPYNATLSSMAPTYHNNNNQINLRELEQILTSSHHTIVDNGESFKSNDFKIYHLRDFSTTLDRLSLLSKVKIAKEIDEPIAIVTRAVNGNQYISIFDDDERAEVTFDTWDEYFNVAQFLHQRFKHIKEQCDFRWGPLDLKSPNSDLNLTFLSDRPTSDFLDKFQQEVSLTHIQNILKSSPELMINGKPVPECTISFTYVDHKYLPFRCQLVYNDGVLVQGKEFLAAIEERIKPNDFIEYLEIKSDGLTKMSGIRFQIK